MATLADGREVPDHFTDIADGGPPTKTKLSLRTRALGIALGAAETIVPAAGSPKETLRQMAKAAKDYIVHGVERGFMRTAYDQGHAIGEAAAAGDPHAQGAALALGAGALLGGARVLNAEMPVLTRGPIDLTPSPKPPLEPLDVPAFQRRPAPDLTRRFSSDQAVRAAATDRAHTERLTDIVRGAEVTPNLADPQVQKALADLRPRMFRGQPAVTQEEALGKPPDLADIPAIAKALDIRNVGRRMTQAQREAVLSQDPTGKIVSRPMTLGERMTSRTRDFATEQRVKGLTQKETFAVASELGYRIDRVGRQFAISDGRTGERFAILRGTKQLKDFLLSGGESGPLRQPPLRKEP